MNRTPAPVPTVDLGSFGTDLNVIIVGASGGIGRAFVEALTSANTVTKIFCLARTPLPMKHEKQVWLNADIEDDASLEKAIVAIRKDVDVVHLVIVATGRLHDGETLKPEKTWRALTASAMENLFKINTIGPAMVAKHCLPLLAKNRKSAFAALSARVGSIEDNRLGGWHAYRASKAALNMLLKTMSIELAMRNPTALCVGLHPGTVDTHLSAPFQKGVAEDKLFTTAQSARYLLTVLDGLTPAQTGRVFAWDGNEIPS